MTDAAAVSGYVDELAAGWLHELRRDPVRAVEGLQLSVAAHQGGSPQWLADLAMSLSEDHRMAEPDDPSAPAWCDFCGATTGLEETDELGTGDAPCACHNMVTRPCADTDACVSRREAKFPPDMDRVPGWVLDSHRSLSEEEAAGALVRAAAGQAAREYYAELVQAAGDEEVALAGQPVPLLPGWSSGSPYGAWDTRGDFIPVNFNWSHWNWRHTIGGHPANRSHLISGNHLTPARLSAMAKVNQARGAQVAQGSYPQQPAETASGGQGGQSAPEAAGRGLAGFYEAARGKGDHPTADIQMQQPDEPAGAPQRPGQPQRPPRDRYGRRYRRLRYSAGRRPVRKPPQDHPGTGGSDSFHGGGLDTGGASGGAAET